MYNPPDANDDIQESNRMVKDHLQLSRDVFEVGERLDGIEAQLRTLISNQEHMMRALSRLTKKDRTKEQKRPPSQKPKSTKTSRLTSSDMSTHLYLPEALQRNIIRFINDFQFNPTTAPDDLVAYECLSEDECSVIASKSSIKDQTRSLIRKIKARGPEVIKKFLDIIGKDHPDLPSCVYSTLEEIEKENSKKPICVICLMQQSVDLKDIGDVLWQSKIISDDIYDDICDIDNIHLHKQLLWRYVISAINHYENPSDAIEILEKSLKTKYNHIAKHLGEISDRNSLNCVCCVRRRLRMRHAASNYGSLTDMSTTSQQIPKVIQGYDTSEEYSSLSSSLDQPSGHSFDALERYESISSEYVQSNVVSSTTFDSVCVNDRKRHSSGHFVPQKLKEEFDLTQDEHNKSIHVIDTAQQADSEGGERPDFKHSISTQSIVTVCGKQSSGSGDATEGNASTDETVNIIRSSVSTDPEISPEVKISDVKLSFPTTDEALESSKGTDVEDPSTQTLFERQKAYRRRRHKSSSDANDADVEDHAGTRSTFEERARQRHQQRKIFSRQKSVPSENIQLITEPRKALEQAACKIGVRRQISRKKKRSSRRELRRQRSQGATENISGVIIKVPDSGDVNEQKGLKKPYNPLLGQGYLHPKMTPKWDYNQAKRHRKMSEMSANVERVKSDTDLRSDDTSDTWTYSDFTA